MRRKLRELKQNDERTNVLDVGKKFDRENPPKTRFEWFNPEQELKPLEDWVANAQIEETEI